MESDMPSIYGPDLEYRQRDVQAAFGTKRERVPLNQAGRVMMRDGTTRVALPADGQMPSGCYVGLADAGYAFDPRDRQNAGVVLTPLSEIGYDPTQKGNFGVKATRLDYDPRDRRSSGSKRALAPVAVMLDEIRRRGPQRHHFEWIHARADDPENPLFPPAELHPVLQDQIRAGVPWARELNDYCHQIGTALRARGVHP